MGTAYRLHGGKPCRATLTECFPFLEEEGHVIALVGAGGKTTLMYALAGEFCRRGLRTAVTTTTHIFQPKDACGTLEDCRTHWANGRWVVWGRDGPDGKLNPLPNNDFSWLLQESGAVLVEADGAKRFPCKVPAAHEPQIPPQADIVIGVQGLSALGRPLKEVCFRLEESEELLECSSEHCLTPHDLTEILLSVQGTRKQVGERTYYTVLNQCDDRERLVQGLEVLRLLEGRGQRRAALTCFWEETHGT